MWPDNTRIESVVATLNGRIVNQREYDKSAASNSVQPISQGRRPLPGIEAAEGHLASLEDVAARRRFVESSVGV